MSTKLFTINKMYIIMFTTSKQGGVKMNYQLKQNRLDAGLTMEEIANKVSISKGYYSLLENGKRRINYELALKIANVLGVKPDSIFLEFESTKSKQ